MIESLYISPDLFDNHGLSESSFEGLMGPRQDTLDQITGYTDNPSQKPWHNVLNTESVNVLENKKCITLFDLDRFSHIRRWVEYNILLYTKSNQFKCLRSWYMINNGEGIEAHHHHYPSKNRTVSGVFFVQGNYAPLTVGTNTVTNTPGRLVLFNGYESHEVKKYIHDGKPRISISFDYRITNQPMCECPETTICFKCFQTKHKYKHKEGEMFKGYTFDYLKSNDLYKR